MAGDHVPVMPFVDVVGKAGIGSFAQYGPTASNVGEKKSGITIV